MNWFSRTFYRYTSSVAIFFVERRLKREPGDPAKWILLAKLYEVKQAKSEAIQSLKSGLEVFPNSVLLKAHLNRLQKKAGQT